MDRSTAQQISVLKKSFQNTVTTATGDFTNSNNGLGNISLISLKRIVSSLNLRNIPIHELAVGWSHTQLQMHRR